VRLIRSAKTTKGLPVLWPSFSLPADALATVWPLNVNRLSMGG